MTTGAPTWRNWAGNQGAHPAGIEHPRDIDEVVLAVKRALAAGRQVRVAGSGHSFTAAAVTDGTLLQLDLLEPVFDADPATGLVTVHAGMTLYELNKVGSPSRCRRI